MSALSPAGVEPSTSSGVEPLSHRPPSSLKLTTFKTNVDPTLSANTTPSNSPKTTPRSPASSGELDSPKPSSYSIAIQALYALRIGAASTIEVLSSSAASVLNLGETCLLNFGKKLGIVNSESQYIPQAGEALINELASLKEKIFDALIKENAAEAIFLQAKEAANAAQLEAESKEDFVWNNIKEISFCFSQFKKTISGLTEIDKLADEVSLASKIEFSSITDAHTRRMALYARIRPIIDSVNGTIRELRAARLEVSPCSSKIFPSSSSSPKDTNREIALAQPDINFDEEFNPETDYFKASTLAEDAKIDFEEALKEQIDAENNWQIKKRFRLSLQNDHQDLEQILQRLKFFTVKTIETTSSSLSSSVQKINAVDEVTQIKGVDQLNAVTDTSGDSKRTEKREVDTKSIADSAP